MHLKYVQAVSIYPKSLTRFCLGSKKFFLGYSLLTTKPLVYVGCVVELEVWTSTFLTFQMATNPTQIRDLDHLSRPTSIWLGLVWFCMLVSVIQVYVTNNVIPSPCFGVQYITLPPPPPDNYYDNSMLHVCEIEGRRLCFFFNPRGQYF